jgi:hypothetical protein
MNFACELTFNPRTRKVWNDFFAFAFCFIFLMLTILFSRHVKMNHEKSIEEREEERLMRAFAGAKPKPIKIGGSSDDHVNVPTLTSPKGAAAPAATHHSTAASSSTTATTTTTEVVSPRKKDEIPLWKQRQLAAEEETRQRLEREAIEKQKAIQHRVQHKEIDDVPTALSPRLNAPDADKHIEQERILVNYMKHNSTAGDLEKAQKGLLCVCVCVCV